jgi:hypothetical protein
MSKSTGLGDNLYVAGYNLSGDTGGISRVGGGPGLLPVTGIDKSAMERLGGVRDGGLSFEEWFNPSASQEHPVLSALPTADVLLTYFRGTAIGNAAASVNAKQVNYDPTRGSDGSLTIAVDAVANSYGVEMGRQLTAGVRADTGATNGTGYDGGGATAFGLQAYLQVFAFTGTDVTVKLQESSDDGSADAYADVTGGGFTEISSAPLTERIATAVDLAVEQWLRVVTVTTGGFTALSFAVMVVRNQTTPEF